jgi:hypothetical protein
MNDWKDRKKRLILGAIAAAALALPATAVATPVSYNFDSTFTTNQGWTVAQDQGGSPSAPSWSAAGGNPLGFIFGTDSVTDGTGLFAFESPEVPGHNLSANYGGAMSADLAISGSSTTVGRPVVFIISDTAVPPDAIEIGLTPPAGTGFHTLSAPLTETAGWIYCPGASSTCDGPATQSQFKSVLATALFDDIVADYHNGTNESYGLDNVLLTDAPPVIPQPVVKKKKCKKKKKHHATAAKKKKCKKKKKKHSSLISFAR